jgi:hypothetical protein
MEETIATKLFDKKLLKKWNSAPTSLSKVEPLLLTHIGNAYAPDFMGQEYPMNVIDG